MKISLKTAAIFALAFVIAGAVLWSLTPQFFKGLFGKNEFKKESFYSSIPQIFRTPGGDLELARVEVTESLTRELSNKTFLGISIPKTASYSEIKVPVTYRYHITLSNPWEINVREGICYIKAPALKPTLPPGINTEGIQKFSKQGWFRWDKDKELEELQKSITPRLTEIAGSDKMIDLVKGNAKKTVAEFVQSWLLTQKRWSKEEIKAIRVDFANELNNDDDITPTLSIP
ncbi:MAG: hypothetical protein SFU91_06460 [Chloroherpetonaceae bacterium]|nr:hypothetical protein [Chloroherpetonaceae bacterium]